MGKCRLKLILVLIFCFWYNLFMVIIKDLRDRQELNEIAVLDMDSYEGLNAKD